MMTLLFTATHGSCFVPQEFMSRIALDSRLLKNFSDFATAQIVRDCEYKIVCSFSRILGDPNRERSATDIFREEDFNSQILWREPLTNEEKQTLLETYYDAYHEELVNTIDSLRPTFLFDIHDTGEWLLGKKDVKREGGFPDICLSNDNNATCSQEDLELLAQLFEKHLNVSVSLNNPYTGGYVTKKYSSFCKTVQIEFNRSLYMDEHAQEIDVKKMQNVRQGFMKVIQEFEEK